MANEATVCDYPVVIQEHSDFVFAFVPDLSCDAVGVDADDAVNNVRRVASRRLREFGDSDMPLPEPSDISVENIELQAPQSRGAGS
jgi:hypothetical protein